MLNADVSKVAPGIESGRARRVLIGLVVLAGSLAAVLVTRDAGDYQRAIGPAISDNAAPAVNALIHGRLGEFFALHPYMGSFSLVLRAPFAGLAQALGASDLVAYRVGALPCVLIGGLVGAWLAQIMAQRGRSLAAQLTVVGLCVINPMTLDGLRLGHPEEQLGAALCVAALLAARGRRATIAGVLLGLALATKQWAIVAILPVVLAAPCRRWHVAVVGAIVAASLTLPLLIGDSDRFVTIAHEASQTLRAPATSLWAPFAVTRERVYFDGAVQRTATGYSVPPSLAWLPRVLIVLSAVALALAYWRRCGAGGEGALGLLALCFLVRGLLDPISPGYYYVPFLMALAGWEGLRRQQLPLLTMLSASALWLFFAHLGELSAFANQRWALTTLYLIWALPLTAVLAWQVYRPGRVWPSPGMRLPRGCDGRVAGAPTNR